MRILCVNDAVIYPNAVLNTHSCAILFLKTTLHYLIHLCKGMLASNQRLKVKRRNS